MQARSIITRALRELRVLAAGEVPSGDDAALCLESLNLLLDAMKLEPGYAVRMVPITFTLNGSSATIGASQTINVARPVRIEDGFCRVGGVDYGFRAVGHEEYQSICHKSVTSAYPIVAHFDGNYPTGTVYFWPPAQSLECHMFVASTFTSFEDTGTEYDAVPGLERMLALSLAVDVADMFHKPVSQSLIVRSGQAKRAFKRANTRVPELAAPDEPTVRWWVP